jgi:Cof subfamily protein (haloacid dehalogenase superfamily)
MSIKLIAVDLDDTLLDNSQKVSPRVKAAVRSAVAEGVAVTLSTGRMHRSALPYALELDLDIPLITYNGALIRSSLSGETLLHRPLEAQTAAEVLALFRERGWYIQAYIDDVLYVKERDAMSHYYEGVSGVKAIPIGDKLFSLDTAPTKLLAMAEPELMAQIRPVLAAHFGDRLYAAISKPLYLEIVDPSVNKGTALEFLAKRLGIGREAVMAMGDSLNDLDMIQYAGWGVAMGNAREEVKKIARVVTGRNDADGVAEAIEKYVLEAAGEK